MNEPISNNNNFEKVEGLLHDLISDRTWNDVLNNVLKGQINPSDLNRVEVYCKQLAKDLTKAGYKIDVDVKCDWSYSDLRKETELERIRQNILKLMIGYHYITKIYSSVSGFNYNSMNNWEQILKEIYQMLYGMENYFVYSGVANSGQNRVWQNRFRHFRLNRNLRAYDRVDYIASNNGDWLDTLITIDDNLKVEVDFQYIETPAIRNIFIWSNRDKKILFWLKWKCYTMVVRLFKQ